MQPKVSIIILNWNGWSDTMECLESLNRLDYSNFEIILIDNGSKEKPPLVNVQFLKLSIFQVFNEENLGFAGGNNQGINIALERGADYILLLNNDTTVEPDFLKKLIAVAKENKNYGILGPVINYYDEPDKIWFAGGQLNWLKTRGTHITDMNKIYSSSGISQQRDEVEKSDFEESSRLASLRSNSILEVDYITGCCLLIKKEVIEKIGLLAEEYFLYYEDTDWCQRARRAGYLCGLAGEAKIFHKQSRSAQEFSYPYIYYHSRNGLIFASRFGVKILVYLASGWIFLKQIIKIIIGHKKEWAKPVWRGVWDFWRGKKGKLEGYY